MKRFFALLPVLWLVVGIIAIATEINAKMPVLSEKIDTNVVLATLWETSHVGYLSLVQK